MYLKECKSGDLVEVQDVVALFDPCADKIAGRFHAGEEMQDTESFPKVGLAFPSGEQLPRCWLDPSYLR